ARTESRVKPPSTVAYRSMAVTYVAIARASPSMLARSAIGTALRIRPSGSMTKTTVVWAPPPVTPYALHTEGRPDSAPDTGPRGGPVRNSHLCVMSCSRDHRRTSRTDAWVALAFTATTSVSVALGPSISPVRRRRRAVRGHAFVHRLLMNVSRTPLPRNADMRRTWPNWSRREKSGAGWPISLENPSAAAAGEVEPADGLVRVGRGAGRSQMKAAPRPTSRAMASAHNPHTVRRPDFMCSR